jgi:hypothetical protein
MAEKFTKEEVALLIRARQLLKDKGLSKDSDVTDICEAAGISRKTGYEWASEVDAIREEERARREELDRLKAEQKDLKKRLDDVEWENEGRKVAWEIHRVDELIAAAKKNTTDKQTKKKR